MTRLKITKVYIVIFILILAGGCERYSKEIERPEKVVSKRQVVYDEETYSKLADLWKAYYSEFPSEDAYANWMYAARYADRSDYESLLQEGLNKYPANPTLLYLKAITKQGLKNNLESIQLLEKAAKLDPTYLDPWFSLAVNYMSDGENEKFDVALRHLLEGGAIADEIMDYNYNILTLLEKDAILVTNGDNDTYPGWVLTRILNYRTDVRIVNRSLLNTEWYPKLIKTQGIPNFITQENLDELRTEILIQIKEGKRQMPASGPLADTLISKLIETALSEDRPIYLAATLYSSDIITRYREMGLDFGLVTLVSSAKKTYPSRFKTIIDKWLNEFRTGGLNSWQLVYGKESLAGRHIVMNYAAAVYTLMDEIIEFTPNRRLALFNWYKKNLSGLLKSEDFDKFNKIWCRSTDIKEIREWCEANNYIE